MVQKRSVLTTPFHSSSCQGKFYFLSLMWSFNLQEKSAESDTAEGSAWKNQNDDDEEDLKPPEGGEDNDEEEEEDEFDEGDEEILTKSGESSRVF